MGFAQATVQIRNRLGLHLRAASALAQTAGRFEAEVTVESCGKQVNARSITELMILGAAQGSRLRFRARGPDARDALKALRQLIEDRFGEE